MSSLKFEKHGPLGPFFLGRRTLWTEIRNAQQRRTTNSRKVCISIVEADRNEGVVWISPVCERLNGWSGENRCAAEIPVLRARANAA